MGRLNRYKLKLNSASLLVREIRSSLKLDSLNTFPTYYNTPLSHLNIEIISDVLNKAEEARGLLKEVEVRNPGFSNGYYKMVELLTMQIKLLTEIARISNPTFISFALECLAENDIQTAIYKSMQEADKAMGICEKIDGNMLSFLYCKYGYYSLFDDETGKKLCREIRAHIEKTTKTRKASRNCN